MEQTNINTEVEVNEVRENVNGPSAYEDGDKRRPILSFNCRIGDKIVMAVRSDDDGYTKRTVRNGTKGVIVGFHRRKYYEPLFGFFRPPGLYEVNGQPIVEWEGGVFDTPSCHDIIILTSRENDPIPQDEYRKAFETRVRIGDLPETPFYPLDRVEWYDDGQILAGTVSMVEYMDMNAKWDNGRQIPWIEIKLDGSGSVRVDPDELRLLLRGNVYYWYHDKSKLGFASIEEEAHLHKGLGLYDQIINPKTGNYHWPKEDVLGGLQTGIIDVINHHSMFGAQAFHGLKFRDQRLSDRLRAKSLEGGW